MNEKILSYIFVIIYSLRLDPTILWNLRKSSYGYEKMYEVYEA